MNDKNHASKTSPCVNVCRISDEHGYCGGCKRTQEEISQWRYYSNEMREAILEDLKNRKDI